MLFFIRRLLADFFYRVKFGSVEGLNKANRQGDCVTAVARDPALDTGAPAMTSEPPLIPAPPDGPRVAVRVLTTAKAPCRACSMHGSKQPGRLW
eukprot:COSAG01_NODE_6299_length_3748_cov_3.059468_3_plen_94_part_00